LTASISTASAQNISNEAWIGQTGDTNTITITQTGIGNAAGANAATLEINQDGRFNALVIDQFGWNNKAGASEMTLPAAPQGINQVGDHNVANVSQSDDRDDGANSIGAIFQGSETGLNDTANRLDVEQNASDGDGSASHSIGFVSQTNTSDGLAANVARLLQTGGFAGIGNSIERIVQHGYGNLLRVVQAEQDNSVGFARQIGDNNQFSALQGEGQSNRVVEASQIGTLNHARISQSGDRNYVASVFQNNEGVAISGNTLVVTLAGNDNGGDGFGGMGAFESDEAKAVSVYQGTFYQIGDDNDTRFTVNGGDDNLFGVYQEGGGNGAIVAIGRSTGPAATYASGNEVAVVQIGDDNALSATVIGNGNAIGTTMRGERNSLSVEQTGDTNKISVSIQGNDNNNSNSPVVGGFTGDVGALSASLGLTPGQGLQSGDLNQAVIKVVSGNGNLFAFTQQGNENVATFDLSGTSNQSLISQAGDTDSAQIMQSGTGNSMAISQF
jgi:hypothetical protein